MAKATRKTAELADQAEVTVDKIEKVAPSPEIERSRSDQNEAETGQHVAQMNQADANKPEAGDRSGRLRADESEFLAGEISDQDKSKTLDDDEEALLAETEAMEPLIEEAAALQEKVFATIARVQEQAIAVSIARAAIKLQQTAIESEKAELRAERKFLLETPKEELKQVYLDIIADIKADYAERKVELEQKADDLASWEKELGEREAALNRGKGQSHSGASKGGRPAKDPYDIEWELYPDYEIYFPYDAGKLTAERRNTSGLPWTRSSISVAYSRAKNR